MSGGATRTRASTPERSRRARSTTPRPESPKRGPAHRSPGRWPVATRAHSEARRSTRGRSGSRSAWSSCSASQTSAGRCRFAISTCSRCCRSRSRSGTSTTGTSSRASRLPIRRSSTCSHAASGSARAARPVRAARPLWKPAVLLAAAVFLIGFRIGLNLEDSNVIDVGYAGVIGAQRIASGVMPYDNFPKEDDLKACGPADSRGRDSRPDPVQRALRVCEPARRHLRPGCVRGVPPGLLDPGLVGQVGQAAGRASHVDHLRRALRARPGARRLTLRRPLARCSARVRVGSVPVHPVRLDVEHERRDRAGLSHLRLLARRPRRGRAGPPSRSPAGRSSRRSSSRRSG